MNTLRTSCVSFCKNNLDAFLCSHMLLPQLNFCRHLHAHCETHFLDVWRISALSNKHILSWCDVSCWEDVCCFWQAELWHVTQRWHLSGGWGWHVSGGWQVNGSGASVGGGFSLCFVGSVKWRLCGRLSTVCSEWTEYSPSPNPAFLEERRLNVQLSSVL